MPELPVEFEKWLTFATITSRNGKYNEQWRERSAYAVQPNGLLICAAICDEGGHERDILDSNSVTHHVRYLGTIGIHNHAEGVNTEVMFLDDGRTFLFNTEGDRLYGSNHFVTVAQATKLLEENIQV